LSQLLGEADIPYERTARTLGVSPTGGYQEYFFDVPVEWFYDAIHIIKNYYGFFDEPGSVLGGECPACHFKTTAHECPDCGLSFDPGPLLNEDHPFYIFLKDNDLL